MKTKTKKTKIKKTEIKHIKCKHIELEKGGYHYDLGSDQELWLCEICNMNLAMEIMKQLALEVFI